MEELIRFFLIAVIVALFSPRLAAWFGILSKEKMVAFYKSIGAIPKGEK